VPIIIGKCVSAYSSPALCAEHWHHNDSNDDVHSCLMACNEFTPDISMSSYTRQTWSSRSKCGLLCFCHMCGVLSTFGNAVSGLGTELGWKGFGSDSEAPFRAVGVCLKPSKFWSTTKSSKTTVYTVVDCVDLRCIEIEFFSLGNESITIYKQAKIGLQWNWDIIGLRPKEPQRTLTPPHQKSLKTDQLNSVQLTEATTVDKQLQ